jgi:hypothetical protein
MMVIDRMVVLFRMSSLLWKYLCLQLDVLCLVDRQR